MGSVHHAITMAAASLLALLGGTGGLRAQAPANVDPGVRSAATNDWAGRTREHLRASEYQVTWQDGTVLAGGAPAYHAPNRAQDFRVYFTEGGTRIVPRREQAPSWTWGLELIGIGTPGHMSAPAMTDSAADGDRFEYRRDALVEWYVNRDGGLEHGFTLYERPAGNEGDQHIDLRVHGGLAAVLSADAQGVDFRAPSGEVVIRYDHLVVTDATGNVLPSRMALDGATLSLVFDDAGAAYPVLVDPVATNPSFTDEGDQVDPEFGIAVHAAGDVNGDGYDDVLVGARQYDAGQSDEGKVFLYAGSSGGLSPSPVWSAEGNQAGALFGSSVSTARDINKDGCDEIMIGAPNYVGESSGEGRAFCFSGSLSMPAAQPDWIGKIATGQAKFGTSVSDAGDVNGDGFGDVVIGAEEFDSNRGAVYVFHGAKDGLQQVAAITLQGTQLNGKLGLVVSCAGDVNGDGYDDILVGEPRYDVGAQIDAGRVHVFHGSPSGIQPVAIRVLSGSQFSGRFGESVSAAGDVNNDGYGDIIIGEKQYTGQFPGEGRALVYTGSATGIGATAKWTMTGGQPGANFGHAVSDAGDTNGDGFDDILIGAPFHSNGESFEGRAYVFQGSPLGPENAPTWSFEPNKNTSWFGYAVGAAGDFDGDFFDDIIVGAVNLTDEELFEGMVYAFNGEPDLPNFSALALDDASPVAVSAVQGEAPPAAVARHVFNVGSPGSKLSWAYVTTPVVNWMQLVPSESAGLEPDDPPQQILFSFDQDGLLPGVYTTSVKVLNIFHPEDFEVVAVQFTVTAHPSELCLDSTKPIARTTFVGDPVPAPESRQVLNCGLAGSLLEWSVAEVPAVGWLSVNGPTGAPVPAGLSAAISVGFNQSGLGVGTYQTVLRFENVKKPTNFIEIPVTMTVEAPAPKASLDVQGPIEAEYWMGAPVPVAYARKVINAGAVGTLLDWSVTELPQTSWISVTPTSGTDVPNGPSGQAITIALDPTGLDEGLYGATLAFTNVDKPANVVYLPVTLEVRRPPSDLCVNGSAIAIQHVLGDPDPAPIVRMVSNCGPAGSQLAWSAAEAPPASWLGVSPGSGGALGAGQATGVALTLSLGGLGVGNHACVVRFANTDDPADFADVVVTVDVAEPEPDLAVSTTGTIVVNHVIGGASPPPVVVGVRNLGNPASSLAWSVKCEAGSWIMVTPGSGVLPGQQEAPVTVTCVPDGLPDGTYPGVLRFENVEDHSDFELVEFELVIGHPRFDPGDTLLGVVDPIEFEKPSEIQFDSVEGMKLRLEFPPQEQKLRLLVTLLDPQAKIVRSFIINYKNSGVSAKKKTVKLKLSGVYTLRVQGAKGFPGDYVIETSRTLPKTANGHTVKLADSGDGTATAEVLCLAGAVFDAQATHTAKGATVQIDLDSLTMPSGAAIAAETFMQSMAGGGLAVEQVPADESGRYRMRFSGFAPGKDKLKVVLDPQQPAEGDDTVTMP